MWGKGLSGGGQDFQDSEELCMTCCWSKAKHPAIHPYWNRANWATAISISPLHRDPAEQQLATGRQARARQRVGFARIARIHAAHADSHIFAHILRHMPSARLPLTHQCPSRVELQMSLCRDPANVSSLHHEWEAPEVYHCLAIVVECCNPKATRKETTLQTMLRNVRT